jgi:hypothetical protein
MDERFWIYCNMNTNSTSLYCNGIGKREDGGLLVVARIGVYISALKLCLWNNFIKIYFSFNFCQLHENSSSFGNRVIWLHLNLLKEPLQQMLQLLNDSGCSQGLKFGHPVHSPEVTYWRDFVQSLFNLPNISYYGTLILIILTDIRQWRSPQCEVILTHTDWISHMQYAFFFDHKQAYHMQKNKKFKHVLNENMTDHKAQLEKVLIL